METVEEKVDEKSIKARMTPEMRKIVNDYSSKIKDARLLEDIEPETSGWIYDHVESEITEYIDKLSSDVGRVSWEKYGDYLEIANALGDLASEGRKRMWGF